MKKIALTIANSLDFINLWAGKICSFIILPMIAIVFYEVIARRFFNKPTIWALEIVTMLFGIYIIWSAAPSLLAKAQVNMDVFYGKWKPRTKAIVDSLTAIFGYIFCIGLFLKSLEYTIESWQIKEIANPPLGQPLYHWRIILTIGTFLLPLQFTANFIRNIWFTISGEELK